MKTNSTFDRQVATLRRMSDMLKRDYETWTTAPAAIPAAAASADAEKEAADDNEDDLFSTTFDLQGSIL
jgi:hypothetical protein